jgi:hypothetical protein
MSDITKPIMLDETGRAIVNALMQNDIVAQKTAEISAAADAKLEEVLASIPDDYTALESTVDSLKTYVTPEMFGAVGDATTNDTEAVQSALNYGGINKLPVILTKMYKVSELKINYDNIHVIGNGQETGFIALNNGNLISTDKDVCTDFVFRDFLIDGKNYGGTGIYSILGKRLSSYLLDRITIQGFENGMDIESWVTNITNCLIRGCTNGMKLHGCNALRIEGCSFFGVDNDTVGIGIYNSGYCTSLRIVNNTFQELECAMYFQHAVSVTISGNYIEQCGTENYAAIELDASITRDLNNIVVDCNYIVGGVVQTEAQATAISCKYVVDIKVGIHYVSSQFATVVLFDSNCDGISEIRADNKKVINESKRVTAVRMMYTSGAPTDSANTIGACGWDRYNGVPLWWNGSVWKHADGTPHE